jgi:hypothetical protein
MLPIRPEQWAQLQKVAEAQFVGRVAVYLQRAHPRAVAGLDRELVEQRVAQAVARARTFGLTSEYALCVFAGLTFTIAPNFDAVPAVRSILADPAHAPNDRMVVLLRRLTPADWLDVRRLAAAIEPA